MKINAKTITELRKIINGDELEKPELYRSGPKLIDFFHEFGFNTTYNQGFPSRWRYTEDCLNTINDTPSMEKCIKKAFKVEYFIPDMEFLDVTISEFNRFLIFDKKKVVRKEMEILILDMSKISEVSNHTNYLNKEEFLQSNYSIEINKLDLNNELTEIIKSRFNEVKTCINYGAYLASIILMGSILEAVLLNLTSKYPQRFNKSKSAPKGSNSKVKKFYDWTLNDLIQVSYELGFLSEDVKRFSYEVRYFRNYIHPYEQLTSCFYPTKDTANICFQVLKAAINSINNYQDT